MKILIDVTTDVTKQVEVPEDVTEMIGKIAEERQRDPWAVVLDLLDNAVEEAVDQYDLEWPRH